MLKSKDQILLEKRYILVREADEQPNLQQPTSTNVTPNQQGATQQQSTNQQQGANQQQGNRPVQINTFGDLSKLLRDIELKSKGKAALNSATNFAVDQLLGLVPGGSNVKTAYDFFKAVVAKPDTKKTNSVLDKLDIDDDVSKIVDNTVEAAFLAHLKELIAKHDQKSPIPTDWNMTKELDEFIKNTYHGRSIEIPR